MLTVKQFQALDSKAMLEVLSSNISENKSTNGTRRYRHTKLDNRTPEGYHLYTGVAGYVNDIEYFIGVAVQLAVMGTNTPSEDDHILDKAFLTVIGGIVTTNNIEDMKQLVRKLDISEEFIEDYVVLGKYVSLQTITSMYRIYMFCKGQSEVVKIIVVDGKAILPDRSYHHVTGCNLLMASQFDWFGITIRFTTSLRTGRVRYQEAMPENLNFVSVKGINTPHESRMFISRVHKCGHVMYVPSINILGRNIAFNLPNDHNDNGIAKARLLELASSFSSYLTTDVECRMNSEHFIRLTNKFIEDYVGPDGEKYIAYRCNSTIEPLPLAHFETQKSSLFQLLLAN